MAFTQLTDDLNIITALPDLPNDSPAHDGAWLRAKFDEAANKIKTYINSTLLSELGATGAAAKIGVAAISGITADPNLQDTLEEMASAIGSGVSNYAVTHSKLSAYSDGVTNTPAVEAANIKDGEVTHAKLAANAVEAGNIKDGEVTHAKLAADAVERANIKDGAVTDNITGITIPSTYTTTESAWTQNGANYEQTVTVTGIVSGTAFTAAAGDDASVEAIAALANITFTAGDDEVKATSTAAVTVDIPVKFTQSGTDYDATYPYQNTIVHSYWSFDGPPYVQDVTASGLVPEDPDDPTTTVTWTCNSADADILAEYAKLTLTADTDTVHISANDVIALDIPCIATQDNVPYNFSALKANFTATGTPVKLVLDKDAFPALEVPLSYITANDTPIVDIVPSTIMATADEQLEAYSAIFKIVTGTKTLTLYASVPLETDVPIQLKVVRK